MCKKSLSKHMLNRPYSSVNPEICCSESICFPGVHSYIIIIWLQIYGVCRGTFDIVFDWLRKKPGSTSDYPRYIFNTYFFRDNHYWMYENRANRTRFGDPLYIANEWKGLPNDIDGYTQILFRIGVYEYDIQTYFFKGECA